MKKLIKYRFIFIILIVLFSTFFVDSPFFGNYYENPPIHNYFLIILFNLLIYLIPTNKFIISEKIVYACIISIISLFGGYILLELILGLIFGFDEFYGELKSPKVVSDFLFYFLTNLIGIGIFKIWLTYKKPIYN